MKKTLLVICLFLIPPMTQTNTDVLSTLELYSGYHSNIFYDSMQVDDIYHMIGGHVSVYPDPSTEILFSGSYSYYMDNRDLSNLSGRISLSYMPTDEFQSLSLLLQTGLYGKYYGTLFEIYNQNGIEGNALFQYGLSNTLRLKSSSYVSYISYPNSYGVSDLYYGVSGGFNWTFLKTNALDFETYLYRRSYTEKELRRHGESRDDFDFLEYNLRYSRPLSKAIGLSLSTLYRDLKNNTEFNISGYTIDNLSPWASLWDGYIFTANLKSYLPKQYTLELSASYNDKEYVKNIDYTDSTISNTETYLRTDQNRSVELKLYKTILTEKSIITPTLQLLYINNSSNMSYYGSETISVNLSTSISF